MTSTSRTTRAPAPPPPTGAALSLPPLLFAYAAGIAAAPLLGRHPLCWLIAPAAALGWFLLRRHRWAGLFLLLFFCTLGNAFYHLQRAPPAGSDRIASFAGAARVTVQGVVQSVSPRPFGGASVELRATRAGANGILAPVRGRLRLSLRRGRVTVAPGDQVRFRSRLRIPRVFGTPGEFDYPRHLAGEGIFATASLERGEDLVLLHSVPPRSLQGRIQRLRRALGRQIDDHLDAQVAPLVRALVTGDKGGITPAQRALLSRAGISHLFAISGLHLGLIALFCVLLGGVLCRTSERVLLWGAPGRYLPLLSLPLLWFYLQLTGAALSTQRAFLMSAAVALLLLAARRTPPLRLLAAAALVILLAAPLALFEPSFQLSFAGVLGILLFVPPWQPRLAPFPRPVRWGANLLLATTGATLGTAPLVVADFHLLAPAGLLANPLAIPMVGFLAVPLGLAGALLLPVWPAAGLLALRGCGAMVAAVLTLARWLTALPGLGGWPAYLAPGRELAVGMCCAALLLSGGGRRRLAARGGLFALGSLLLLSPPPHAGTLAVTAISVGQGTSLLVSTPQGRHYLVDGGGLYGDTFDVGERLVGPALAHLDVRRLDAVILTHDHPDHRKGLLHILANFPVGRFLTGLPFARLHPDLRQVLLAHRVPVVRLPPGWHPLGPHQDASLWVPPRQQGKANDTSLVLYLHRGRDGALLTGDLEATGVRQLLSALPPVPVTLLKLPHHGSGHSATRLLLDRLHPALAFASLGAHNPYGFPAPGLVAALRRRHIPLYRTDRLGTLRFVSAGHGWRCEHWQNGLFH